MDNKTKNTRDADCRWQSPEIRVFTLDVEAGFCQSGQINDVKYLDTYEW